MLSNLVGRRRTRISLMQILLRTGMLNSAAVSIEQREAADLLIRPPIESVDLLDWGAFERTVELGYRHALGVLERHSGKLAAASVSPET
jgi:NTE family protein